MKYPKLDKLSTNELQQKLEFLGIYGISMDRDAMLNALSYLIEYQEAGGFNPHGEKTQKQVQLISAYQRGFK